MPRLDDEIAAAELKLQPVKTQQPEFKARKRSLAANRGRRQVIAPAPSHRGCVRRRCRCEPNRAAERRRRTVVQEPHPPRVCPLMRDPNTVRSVHCASPDFPPPAKSCRPCVRPQ